LNSQEPRLAALEGISIAFVEDTKDNKAMLVIEAMDVKHAKLFSQLGLDKYIAEEANRHQSG
jgi:hypothetical protein